VCGLSYRARLRRPRSRREEEKEAKKELGGAALKAHPMDRPEAIKTRRSSTIPFHKPERLRESGDQVNRERRRTWGIRGAGPRP